MIKMNVSHDTRTRHEYKVRKNGETITKTYTESMDKLSYPMLITVSAGRIPGAFAVGRFLAKLDMDIPCHIEYDENLAEYRVRILYPRDFDSPLSAGDQRNAVLAFLRSQARSVKKSIA